MDFGIGYFPTHDGVDPGHLRAARRGARAPFAVLPGAHPHPRQPRDPIPGGRGAAPRVLPPYDLFVSLAAAATATSTLRIAQRHLPGDRARPDRHGQGGRERGPPLRRSSGLRRRCRLEPRGDANHGTDPRTRMALMAERVEAMKAIWTEEQASYQGEYVELRADLELAQAGTASAPARAGRRQRAHGARPGAPLRRRLDAQQHRRRPRSGARRSCGLAPIARSR